MAIEVGSKIKLSLLTLILCFCFSLPVLAGSNLSTATLLNFDKKINGAVNSKSTEYYRISVPANSILMFHVKTGGHNEHLCVQFLSSTGERLADSTIFFTDDNNNWGYQKVTRYFAVAAGTYFLGIENLNYGTATYTLSATIWKSQTSSVKIGSAFTHKYLSKALPFTVGNTLYSNAEKGETYFKFSLDKKSTIKISGNAFTEGMNASIWLYDSKGELLDQILQLEYGKPLTKNLTLNKGTYFIGALTLNNHRGRFQLTTTNLSAKTGLRMEDGKLVYYRNGVIDTSYTGLVRYNGKWYYLEKGRFSAKTGISKRADHVGGWYYVENGIYRTNKTGLTKRVDLKGGWYYVENGIYRTNKTGLTKRVDLKGGWYYVENGIYRSTRTCIARRIDGIGGRFYVKNGVFQKNFTGTVKIGNNNYYIQRGVVKYLS